MMKVVCMFSQTLQTGAFLIRPMMFHPVNEIWGYDFSDTNLFYG